MSIEKFRTAAALLAEKTATIPEQMREMAALSEKLQHSTAIRKADVYRFVDVACCLVICLQDQNLDIAAQHQEQIRSLLGSNHRLATVFYQQQASIFHPEATA